MKSLRVENVSAEEIVFEQGFKLQSYHEGECCEHHYLSFADLSIADFEGLQFDLMDENFFRRIEGYGIELIPTNGHTVKVPGYGSNNGYYSSDINLVLVNKGFKRTFDVSTCQVITCPE